MEINPIPKHPKSDEKYISRESNIHYHLIKNYTVAIGSYSIVPAKTIFGNNSRTKKVIEWSGDIALGKYECPCGFMCNSTDYKIIYEGKTYYTNEQAMLE
jgi:hypothetical protein